MNDTNQAGILLVEDNQDDLDMALRALREVNLANNIEIARDGEEALEFVFGGSAHAGPELKDRPRLILLDLKLPKIDGLGVLKRLREDPRSRLISVVVMTSSKEQKDVIESYKLGANSYIVKPVNFKDFVNAMQELGMYWLLLNVPPQP